MGKIVILMVVLFLGGLALFSIHNVETTTIAVPFDKAYELPKMALVLISSALGALLMLIFYSIRDTRRFFHTHQFHRQKKKADRVRHLYTTAVNAMMADDEEQARSALGEVLKAEPEHMGALLRMGDIERGRGRLEEASRQYRRALSTEEGNLEGRLSLEGTLEGLGRWEEAEDLIEQIIEDDRDNLTALYRKRALLERRGRWDDVIEVQKDIVRLEQDDDARRETAKMTGYRYELAREALEAGELEKVGKGFRAIIRDDKGFVPAYLGVAESMLGQNDPEGAVSFLEGGYQETGSMIILARLEDLLISLGEPSRLIRIYNRAILEHSRDNHLRFFLAKLYYRLEMIDDAFAALDSIDMLEAYAEMHNLRGELFLRRGQCEKAVAEFKKTLEIRKTLRVPYCCSVCKRSTQEWSGRCPRCGSWNSFRFDLHGSCDLN